MNKNPTKKTLWLAVRFTQLPLDVLKKKPIKPSLVIEKNKVCACNQKAVELNIYPGLSIEKAQLQINQQLNSNAQENIQIEVMERETTQEENRLFDLCDEFYLVTPYIKVRNKRTKSQTIEQGMSLEISASINLFKGLKNLEKRINNILGKLDYQYVLSYGNTEDGAWILTYTNKNITNDAFSYQDILHNIQKITKDRIKPVDIKYLYDFPNEVKKLNNMGFNIFSDLINPQNKSSFSDIRKRLGDEFSLYLYNLLGREEDSQSQLFSPAKELYTPKELFNEQLEFDYPISNIDSLKPYIEELLTELHSTSIKNNQETHEVLWVFYDIKNNSKEYRISFDPKSFHWKFIYDLSLIKFEQGGLPFEINRLQLHCLHMNERHYQNLSLALDNSTNTNHQNQSGTLLNTPSLPLLDNEYSITTAKLSSRIGQGAIKKLSLEKTHIPEQASTEYVFNAKDKKAHQNTLQSNITNITNIANRPEWLFTVPKAIGKQQNQLNWQGKLHLIQGPERIQGNWWHKPIARDYFVAQRDDFTRLWVYHDLKQDQWFAQGIFS